MWVISTATSDERRPVSSPHCETWASSWTSSTTPEAEHRQFDDVVANLDASSADFDAVVMRLFDDLGEHVEREDLGIFPVSVVTLNEFGWQLVDQAHTESPTFLLDHIAPADQVERK